MTDISQDILHVSQLSSGRDAAGTVAAALYHAADCLLLVSWLFTCAEQLEQTPGTTHNNSNCRPGDVVF